MIASASPHQRMMIATVVAGLALLAALWMLAISPKRTESAQVKANVATQQERLAAANTQLASYQAARNEYPKLLAELRRLDGAVPARGEIPALLRELQRRAGSRKSDLRLAALKPGGGPAPAAATPGAILTPGATVGAGGLATLPFTFTYTGEYFDLVNVLGAARRAVTVKSGNLKIDGRLVTIEGLTFERANQESSLIKASIAGTAYIAAATPQPAAVPAAAPTQGGS